MENIRTTRIPFKGCYLNGRFQDAGKTDLKIKYSPADLSDEVIKWREADPETLDEALFAGKKAFSSGVGASLEERKKLLLNVKAVFKKRFRKLALVLCREVGKPLWEAEGEVRSLIHKIDVTLNESLKLIEERKIPRATADGAEGRVRFRPRGLIAVIGPFNFPLHLPNGQISAALLSGNAVIFKPSEKTPACGQALTECFDEAGAPPGLFQMIQGGGNISARLCESPLADGVLFTGSFAVGRKIQEKTAGQFGKISALETGGKNSALIWDFTDLKKAVSETLKGCFLTAGQRCSSTAKVILNKKIAEKFKQSFVKEAEKISVGHWKNNPFTGPLIDKKSLKRFFKHQKEFELEEGGETLLKGISPPDLHGFYVTPGIYQTTLSESPFQTEETFTPQALVYEVETIEEALHIVNHSGYGLVLSLFSEDKAVQEEVFRRAKTGLLNFNRASCGASAKMPFGGMGRSGNDRPAGVSMISSCVTPVSLLSDAF